MPSYVCNIAGNDYDGHTLDAALEQKQRLRGALKDVFVDRGDRGRKEEIGTTIHTPKTFSSKLTNYRKIELKEGFTKRAAIWRSSNRYIPQAKCSPRPGFGVLSLITSGLPLRDYLPIEPKARSISQSGTKRLVPVA